MAKSVWTIPRPPGGIDASLDADKSYPADKVDPRTGSVALSDNFLTNNLSTLLI